MTRCRASVIALKKRQRGGADYQKFTPDDLTWSRLSTIFSPRSSDGTITHEIICNINKNSKLTNINCLTNQAGIHLSLDKQTYVFILSLAKEKHLKPLIHLHLRQGTMTLYEKNIQEMPYASEMSTKIMKLIQWSVELNQYYLEPKNIVPLKKIVIENEKGQIEETTALVYLNDDLRIRYLCDEKDICDTTFGVSSPTKSPMPTPSASAKGVSLSQIKLSVDAFTPPPPPPTKPVAAPKKQGLLVRFLKTLRRKKAPKK